ncbi:hypothetical protein ABTY98_05385 [Streptomyces sp. NPDC096040]|uniref:GP88 family protein n=1 Tax=Streptomyces sp. NPDC096040 TaxID=3155541 RepID=UPI0033316760
MAAPQVKHGLPNLSNRYECWPAARSSRADRYGSPRISVRRVASQDSSDLLAVLGPAPGIPSNNIPAFRRRMKGRTFRQWQAEQDARGARRGSPQMAPSVGGKAGTSRST